MESVYPGAAAKVGRVSVLRSISSLHAIPAKDTSHRETFLHPRRSRSSIALPPSALSARTPLAPFACWNILGCHSTKISPAARSPSVSPGIRLCSTGRYDASPFAAQSASLLKAAGKGRC